MTKFIKSPPPKGQGRRGVWRERLLPLVSKPGRWAIVYECETPEQAQSASDNLNRRRVVIPHPDHNWEFLSRGLDVMAIYRGKGKATSGSVRRSK